MIMIMDEIGCDNSVRIGEIVVLAITVIERS